MDQDNREQDPTPNLSTFPIFNQQSTFSPSQPPNNQTPSLTPQTPMLSPHQTSQLPPQAQSSNDKTTSSYNTNDQAQSSNDKKSTVDQITIVVPFERVRAAIKTSAGVAHNTAVAGADKARMAAATGIDVAQQAKTVVTTGAEVAHDKAKTVVTTGADIAHARAVDGVNIAKTVVTTGADLAHDKARTTAAAGKDIVQHAAVDMPTSITAAAQRAMQRRRDDLIYYDNSSDEEMDDEVIERKKKRKEKKANTSDDATNTKDIDDSDDNDDDDDDDDEDYINNNTKTSKKQKFYKKRRFWSISISILIFCIFAGLGTFFVVNNYSYVITAQFQAWRLCFFIAGLPVIWWLGHGLSFGIVWAVEKSMFSVKNALYIAYAVRRPLRNVFRAVLALGWWAIIMTINSGDQSETVQDAYNLVLKIWACVTLFMTANLLKRLVAKVLALKLNQSSHLQKMYESLKQEQWLNQLLQPRQNFSTVNGNAQKESLMATISNKSKRMAGRIVSSFRRVASTSAVPDRTAQHGHLLHETERSHSADEYNSSSGDNNTIGYDDALMFWRRRSEPMPSIREESTTQQSNNQRGSDGDTTNDGNTTNTTDTTDDNNDTAKMVTIDIDNDNNDTIKKKAHDDDDDDDDVPHRHHHNNNRVLSNDYASINNNNNAAAVTAFTRATTTERRTQSPTRRGVLQRKGKSSILREKRSAVPILGDGPLPKEEILSKLAKLEKYIRKNTLQVAFKDTLNNFNQSSVNTIDEANRLAYYLFWNVKQDFEREEIEICDLETIFSSPKDVEGCFDMLDLNGNGSVSLEECVTAVLNIFTARKNLAASLHDTKSITNVLENIIGVIMHMLFVFFYLMIFQVNIGQAWVSFSGVVLAFSFMFANSVRQTYENIMFLFAVHPYDIGDTLYFDNDYMVVDEISINFTCCLNSANQRVWIPNTKLVTTPFINVTTSGNRIESMKVLIDFNTPSSVLNELMESLDELKKENPKEFMMFTVSLMDAVVVNKLTLCINAMLFHTGVDTDRMTKTRTLLHVCVADTLNRLDVLFKPKND